MPNNLSLTAGGLPGGQSVTGSNLGLAGPTQPQPEPPPQLPNVPPQASQQMLQQFPEPGAPNNIFAKTAAESNPVERFAVNLAMQFDDSGAIARQRKQLLAARAANQEQVTDLMVQGLNATKDIKDPDMRYRAGKAIAQRIGSIGGGKAAASFMQVFEEPAVHQVMFSPETIQEFGSVQKAMAARDADPKAFRQRAVTANIGGIESELFRLRETNPDIAKMDTNANGMVTSAEARNWVRKHIKKGDTSLTPEQMNVIQMPEFEPFLADIFDARTSQATAKAQEKDLKRAINREGKLVFATENEIRRDPSLTPEPKSPLVQFGGDKMNEKLFDSLVGRRDDLRQQAQGAQRTITLARTMRDTAMQTATGVGEEQLSTIKSGAATMARLAGAEGLANQIAGTDVSNAEALRSLNAQAVSAVISSESAGSVSNEERRKFEQSLPGLQNTRAGNVAISHMMEALGQSKVEESAFTDAITEQVARGERRSDVGAGSAFTSYINDLPYTKGAGSDIRFTGGGQNLWRYYLSGRPKRWKFSGGNLTIDEIKQLAETQGLTARELLSIADKKGTLTGVE